MAEQTKHNNLSIVILAAGQGLRMKSSLPKVLHPIAKKPMLGHVLEAAQALNPKQILVVHPKASASQPIFEFLNNLKMNNLVFVEQAAQLGTGDAVAKTLNHLTHHNSDHRVLILYGDVPLISVSTLERLIKSTPEDALGLLTVKMDDPIGLGRIVRNSEGDIQCIVEEKDANDTQRKIQEINTGIFLSPAYQLAKWLPLLTNVNAQKEYYLTDIVELAVKQDVVVKACAPDCQEEVFGVNDKLQQIITERFYQKKLAESYLKQGVWICDPSRFDLRGTLVASAGVSIDVNVILEGKLGLGENTSIGANCILINCEIGNNVQVLANSYLENVKIGDDCIIGPFARLRPGTQLGEGAKVGNFVELKNSIVGKQSKINHLSYIGDAVIGNDVNVGAGTITCNYDGANKHQTIIEDNVHIGSDTQLIAPLRVGKGATIAAGSTVVQDVPADELTLTQTLNQRSKKNWQRPTKTGKKLCVE